MEGPFFNLIRRHTAIRRDIFHRNFFQRQHRAALLVENVQKLQKTGALAVNNVIPKQNGKGLITNKILCAEDGVTEPHSLSLAYIEDVDHLGYFTYPREFPVLPLVVEMRLQFNRNIEVILNIMFAATGDKKNLLNTGSHRLLDDVLHQRLVDQRQHLFGR